MHYKIPPGKAQRIEELRAQGYTIVEIASKIGLSRSAVGWYVKGDKRVVRRGVRLSAEIKSKIINGKISGKTGPEIANELGISKSAVNKYWASYCKKNSFGKTPASEYLARHTAAYERKKTQHERLEAEGWRRVTLDIYRRGKEWRFRSKPLEGTA